MHKFWDLIKETYRGKSIPRILMNWQVFEHCSNLQGVLIDLGAGKDPSYQKYWQIKPLKLIRADMEIDLNKSLPFENNYADAVFLFSVIYIIKKPEELMKEVFRILKSGGKLFIYSPFIFNESREPDDYLRFTSQGLERLLREAGFRKYRIIPVGGRFTAALYLSEKIFLLKTIKLFLRITALCLDAIYPNKLNKLHPCPVGYFVEAIK